MLYVVCVNRLETPPRSVAVLARWTVRVSRAPSRTALARSSLPAASTMVKAVKPRTATPCERQLQAVANDLTASINQVRRAMYRNKLDTKQPLVVECLASLKKLKADALVFVRMSKKIFSLKTMKRTISRSSVSNTNFS